MTSIGVVVNPLAGFGGARALKGSDGPAIAELAFSRGVPTWSRDRMTLALESLGRVADRILAAPRSMGADSANAAGLTYETVSEINGVTSADDTRRVVRGMVEAGVDLVLFAGGDGTARDVLDVASGVVALGVPAGVKIQSACFATSPQAAGRLAGDFLRGRCATQEAEVIDLDEGLVRSGVVASRLYGYIRVPQHRELLQGAKVASPLSEAASHEEIARAITAAMDPECTYFIGPGTTTLAVTRALGVEGTLLGVDVVRAGKILRADADASTLQEVAESGRASIVVTPIGGQGYLFGRGNQQISPGVLARVGTDRVIVVATSAKLASLRGRSLLVDTGDDTLDEKLRGYRRVITGIGHEVVYHVSPAWLDQHAEFDMRNQWTN